MEEVVGRLNGYVWSSALVYSFLGLGLLYSAVTRFVQVRLFKDMVKLAFQGGDSRAGVSSFAAFSMSLGSRVGTGNVAGVATAIALGGPGAVFWMWVAAFLGSATSFIEITLTQTYKTKVNGQYRGGTPYYIAKGLKMKWLAIISAALTLVVMSCLWPGVQANTVALSVEKAFGIEPSVTGIAIACLLALIILGGTKRIAKAAEIMVPFMAIGYILACVFILVFNLGQVPEAFSLIFSSAFGLDATFGGLIGSAIAMGVQRGVYSNGAGIGSETFESGAAEVSHPVKQGLVQAFSVYIDTLLICTATALMILVTGMYDVKPVGMAPIIENIGTQPSLYTQMAIESALPGLGEIFLAAALFFFCFTTLLSYYYKAETCLAFLVGNSRTTYLLASSALKLFLLLAIVHGSIKTAAAVWALGDLGMGLMAWVNLTVIFFLTRPALKALKDYEQQKKAGKNPTFTPNSIGLKGADFWEHEYQSNDSAPLQRC
ncbi:putative sodium/proton-dependent alanine carrier protein YrbD [Pseudomonas sp. 8AS]|uniref:alanine/glycine:cation symporter family protein n=1 Tax=Pseudomonas sp. 8AS TaxID=2653163 RepID=UPI0012F40023|nr:alanine/glycine:cation symporter family protein [Pseudomonas sp. 8AS]VXC13703.1 putative sodium/proton-dependent alanine carrier protein YrbD [Pseudomonas sp. 8AS]